MRSGNKSRIVKDETMSNTATVITTKAGEALIAQMQAENKVLVIDKFIFANVPNRPAFPNRDDVVPVEHVVHESAVHEQGRLTENSVIYSTTLASNVGPFSFNWSGLFCSEHNVLVAINFPPPVDKTVDAPGITGNTLVRSFVLEYKGISETTNITVDPSSWQYDAHKRMSKMDNDTAQAIIDQNGKDWFLDDGFIVTPQSSAYNIKAGAGYVSGHRISLDFDRIIQVLEKPAFIYVDAFREGSPTGEWQTKFTFVVAAEEKDDYTDAQGVNHFVCKIAQVLADGSVADIRKMGELADRIWTQKEIYKNTSGKIHPLYGAVRSAIEKLSKFTLISDFLGADPTGVEPSTQAINNAISVAVSLNYGKLLVDGEYLYEGKLTFVNGLVLKGYNSQNYGEFYYSRPSKIKAIGVPAGEWAFNIPTNARPISIKDVDFEGDWIMNGLKLHGGNREIIIDNVSIKRFYDVFETNTCWASSIDNLKLTGRGILCGWHGGGTAVKLGTIIAQGDKENKIKAKKAYLFRGDIELNNMLNTTKITCCAGQYVEEGVDLSGDVQISLDCFDIEEVTYPYHIHDTKNAQIELSSNYIGATDESKAWFKLSGKIGSNTSIKINNHAALNRFSNENDWRDVLFIESAAAIDTGARFVIPEKLFEIARPCK